MIRTVNDPAVPRGQHIDIEPRPRTIHRTFKHKRRQTERRDGSGAVIHRIRYPGPCARFKNDRKDWQ